MFTTINDDGSLVLTASDLKMLRSMFSSQSPVALDVSDTGLPPDGLWLFQNKLAHMGIELALKVTVREPGVY